MRRSPTYCGVPLSDLESAPPRVGLLSRRKREKQLTFKISEISFSECGWGRGGGYGVAL
jgi:hypothetical protein